MTWWPLLLGWPAIALSTGLVLFGFIRRSEYVVLVAILPIVPVGLYLLGSPIFWWLPIIVVMLLVASSWFIRQRKHDRRP